MKFFHTANMHAQVQLLESLVQLWDPEKDVFDMQDETLEIIDQDIYFITILSHKGAPLSLSDIGHGVTHSICKTT